LDDTCFFYIIETYDYADRLEKLTKDRTKELKEKIADQLLRICNLQLDGPWLWVKYVSQHGHHV
jgi:hypothetical protein